MKPRIIGPVIALVVLGGVALPALGAGLDDVGVTHGATASAPASRSGPPAPPLPPAAQPIDTSRPDRVVGRGTPQSCTSQAVVDAVALGGIITFDCGPTPVTIPMDATAKVVNTAADVVIDGAGTVTLDGQGRRRILYMNTCDPAQVWTTSHCQDQETPRLTVQNIGLVGGNSTGDTTEGGGGGALFVRGGQLRLIATRFVGNRCDDTGPDLGGGAVRVLSPFAGRPVIVASSTFSGNVCSNGAALSSIGVSWQVYASTFTDNHAIGRGANPQRPGTPGGGSGGAIYLDGNTFTVDLVDTTLTGNTANEGGGAVFFVSNDRTGELRITRSVLQSNPSAGFETPGYPGIFFLGAGKPQVTDSLLA